MLPCAIPIKRTRTQNTRTRTQNTRTRTQNTRTRYKNLCYLLTFKLYHVVKGKSIFLKKSSCKATTQALDQTYIFKSARYSQRRLKK